MSGARIETGLPSDEYAYAPYCLSGVPALTIVMKSRGLFGPFQAIWIFVPAAALCGAVTEAETEPTVIGRLPIMTSPAPRK